MTSFTIYGLNEHELMPLKKVFKESIVEKIDATAAARPVDGKEHLDTPEQHSQQHRAEQAYSAVAKLPQNPAVLLAEQVMTSPVVTLTLEAKITEALKLFQVNAFRHVPVVSDTGQLVGIISDRDILRYMAGLTETYQQKEPHTSDDRVEQFMTPRVLTASIDTDVRYIARLFVEQHIGAMPVANEGVLKGIITRSDVLEAVIRNYTLELWV